LRHQPNIGNATIDQRKAGIELAKNTEHRLRIVLARKLGKNIAAGFDRFAAASFGGRDELRCQGVGCCLGRRDYPLRQNACFGGFGQDPQPFGKEQTFGATVLFVAQRS